MREFILSVVIPTRNRAKYANLSIRQVLSVCPLNVQVVVQDNGDDDELEKMISDIIDIDNLVYNRTKKILSFVDNFDLALSFATGKYITIIGDDDGVTSGIYKAAEWALKHNYKAIKPNLNIVYFWPGSKVFDGEKDNGILRVTSSRGSLKYADPTKEIKTLLHDACQDYLNMNLVKIYHGLVSRELLEMVKEQTGKYVSGLSPDIYLSVSLTSVLTEKIVVIDAPLTISGICNASGSSASATGAHTGELKDAPHFIGHEEYVWKKEVPKFYSVETIWADSALAAIYDIDSNMQLEYKAEKLVSVGVKKYPQFKSVIYENYYSNGGSSAKVFCWKIKNTIKHVVNGIKNRMIKREKNEWTDIKDILTASKTIEPFFEVLYDSLFLR